MHKVAALFGMILLVSIMGIASADGLIESVVNLGAISDESYGPIADPTIYKPICLSCKKPNPNPTPTPVPSTKVGVAFDMPSQTKSGRTVTLTAYQISGNPISESAAWRFDYPSGSMTLSAKGKTASIKLVNTGTNKIQLYMDDRATNSYGRATGSIVVK